MEDRLFLQERRQFILNLLDQQGRVSVKALSKRFSISAATIRTDLEALAAKGLLSRTHGGAIVVQQSDQELSFQIRQRLQAKQKDQIGLAAVNLIENGEAIALDASTTALALATQLKDKQGLTVVTNGIFVALALLEIPAIKTLLPGGFVRRDSASLVKTSGYDISARFENFHFQKGFFGAKGLTLEEGLTEIDQDEVALKRALIARTKYVVALVDSSKWGHVSFASFASSKQIDCIITDSDAPQEIIEALRQSGTEVIVVD